MPRARRTLAVISALLVVLGVLAALDVRRGPSADTVLRRARAYVAEHASVRFIGTMKIEVKDDDSDLGEASSFTSSIKGEIESKGRTRALVVAGDEGVSEVVTAGALVYVRVADTVAELRDAKYAKIDTASGAGVMQLESNPAQDLDLGAALAAARNPTKLKHSGNLTTIEVDVSAARLVGRVLAEDIEEITMRLVVHRSGEVRSAVQLTGAQGAVITTTIRYSDWGTKVAIVEPAVSDVDPTPDVDEEAVLAFKDAPLFMPKAIPAGWELAFAGILPSEETAEGCDQVELGYEDPADPDGGYMYLYQFPNGCADPFSGEGVVAFSAGPYRGFGQSFADDGSLVQITVGRTTVQADSDLTLSDLTRVLQAFVPLDFAAQPGQLSGFGGRSAAA